MSLILRSLCAPRILRADLAQVSDFAMHAGLGLLIGVPLAARFPGPCRRFSARSGERRRRRRSRPEAMLVPPAIEAGDVMVLLTCRTTRREVRVLRDGW